MSINSNTGEIIGYEPALVELGEVDKLKQQLQELSSKLAAYSQSAEFLDDICAVMTLSVALDEMHAKVKMRVRSLSTAQGCSCH